MIEKCDFCEKPALKSNGKSELECENRANTGSCKGLEPIRHEKPLQNRNEKCNCGSGKKFKHCCI